MPTLVIDCPHCTAKKMGFTFRGQSQNPRDNLRWSVFGTCNACLKPVCGVFVSHRAAQPEQYPGDLMSARDQFTCEGIYPAPQKLEVPEAIPDNVATAFKQGVESKRAMHWDAACSMYRKAMELALKAFSPEIEAWKLEKRIDKMAGEGKITAEIQSWAHELRLDGNEALHGDECATKEIAEQMHSLCEFILIYLYSLPEQVKAAKARRDRGS